MNGCRGFQGLGQLVGASDPTPKDAVTYVQERRAKLVSQIANRESALAADRKELASIDAMLAALTGGPADGR